MSKPYPYPEDEFDVLAGRDAPEGAHRRPRTAWQRTWPFLLVLVLFPALAYGGVTLASSLGSSSSSDSGAGDPVVDDGGDDPAASDPASSDAAADPAASDPASDPAPAPVETSVAPEAPVLTTPIRVLNASGVTGLAKKKAEVLTGAGYTAVTPDNGKAGSLTASVVFYPTDDLAVTAKAVAATLGVSTVTKDATIAPSGVVVLLLKDLAGG